MRMRVPVSVPAQVLGRVPGTGSKALAAWHAACMRSAPHTAPASIAVRLLPLPHAVSRVPTHGYIFTTTQEREIFRAVLSAPLDFTSAPWPSVSEAAKDVIRRMLVRGVRVGGVGGWSGQRGGLRTRRPAEPESSRDGEGKAARRPDSCVIAVTEPSTCKHQRSAATGPPCLLPFPRAQLLAHLEPHT